MPVPWVLSQLPVSSFLTLFKASFSPPEREGWWEALELHFWPDCPLKRKSRWACREKLCCLWSWTRFIMCSTTTSGKWHMPEIRLGRTAHQACLLTTTYLYVILLWFYVVFEFNSTTNFLRTETSYGMKLGSNNSGMNHTEEIPWLSSWAWHLFECDACSSHYCSLFGCLWSLRIWNILKYPCYWWFDRSLAPFDQEGVRGWLPGSFFCQISYSRDVTSRILFISCILASFQWRLD